jgi:hypothetical protein
MTSEIVTGAAAFTMWLTSWRVAKERPREGVFTSGRAPSKVIGESECRKRRYCFQIGSSRWRNLRARSTASGGACGPATRRAGSAGTRKKMM